MAIKIISNELPFMMSWDEYCYKAGGETNLLQSRYWATVNKDLNKTSSYLSIVEKGNKVMGQALFLKHWLSFRNHIFVNAPFSSIVCSDGPIIIDSEQNVGILESMIRSGLTIARRSFSRDITFIPSHTSTFMSGEAVSSIYKSYGFRVKKWGTYLIDLKQTEDALFMSFKGSARKSVKKCRKLGLRVVKMKSYDEFRKIYWNAYKESEMAFGRKVKPCSEILWKEDKKKYYHYYIVEDSENNILSCLGMYCFNGVATEIASAISPMAYAKKIPAQDLIHWEMMLAAKAIGCRAFDLAGVNPTPENQKELGIRRFKEKWGGAYVEYNIYTRDFMPWLSKGIYTLSRLKRRLIF